MPANVIQILTFIDFPLQLCKMLFNVEKEPKRKYGSNNPRTYPQSHENVAKQSFSSTTAKLKQ